MTFKTISVMGFSIFFGAACTWVDTKPGAESVVMIDRYQAQSCERLGTTSTKTMNKLWLYERDQVTVRKELLGLARNQALTMGGNALMAEKKAEDGQQKFIIYRCP